MYILASSIKIKKSSFGACLDPLVLIEIVWIHLLTCFWIEKKTEPLPPGVSRPEALIAKFLFRRVEKIPQTLAIHYVPLTARSREHTAPSILLK